MRELKIGNEIYTVKAIKNPVLAESGMPLDGVVVFDDKQIIIDFNLPVKEQRSTLFHECLHVAFRQLKMRWSKDREEEIVSKLEEILAPIIGKIAKVKLEETEVEVEV